MNNIIVHPVTNEKLDIFTKEGKSLLKQSGDIADWGKKLETEKIPRSYQNGVLGQ